MESQQPLKNLPGVGAYYSAKLERLGLTTASDLVNHFPVRYLDYGNPSLVADLNTEGEQCVRVTLRSKAKVRIRRGGSMIVTQFADTSGKIAAVWFNMDYLISQLELGHEYFLAGRPSPDKTGRPSFVSPILESVEKGGRFSTGLVPVYPLTEGLSSRFLAQKIGLILPQLKMPEFLSKRDLATYGLTESSQAYVSIHQPKLLSETEAARKRLSFNDLLAVQLKTGLTKRAWNQKEAPEIKFDQKTDNHFVNSLPFKLTADQITTRKEIFVDLENRSPMNRLLQGDVGSGKTVVAAAAAAQVLAAGYQVLFMVPTQVLASQHFETLDKFLSPLGFKPQLVTGGRKSVKSAPCLVGTHALLHREQLIDKEKLGLLVIDEQHRFGVLQRTQFLDGKKAPHLLTMTATPIPRTIALATYGHLELSFLKTKPTGRKKVKTWLVPASKRVKAYAWIKKELKEHASQAFIVCPFVEESSVDTLKNVKAATVEFDRLKKVFSGLKISLLHGRMKSTLKTKILSDFAAFKSQILVTTPVVEVGVDIGRATIMIIEDAYKFGLAQLHQLRGRVGRSDAQSYCLLFTGEVPTPNSQRLKILETTDDGLALAEADLRLRGFGQMFGTAQSGHLETNFSYFWDEALQNETKALAQRLLKAPKKARRILASLDVALAKNLASN